MVLEIRFGCWLLGAGFWYHFNCSSTDIATDISTDITTDITTDILTDISTDSSADI